jgi:non-heme chloroperoxidase
VNATSACPPLDVHECWTERSGVRIRYLDNRPADAVGLPILLSPGFTDRADEYGELLAAAAPRRVLAVEVRGRGGSGVPATGYRSADHADDLRAVLDDAGIGRYHLMTFSRGTTWGLDLALAEPQRVATISVGDYWAAEKRIDREAAAQVMTASFRWVPMSERIAPAVVDALFGDSVERDLGAAVNALGVPVLVATGTRPDCLLGEAGLAWWRERVPGVETVVIPDAGHDLFRPDRLAYPRAVWDLIARRAPGL